MNTFILLFISILSYSQSQNNPQPAGIEQTCCSANLMDSANKIVIDVAFSIEGTFAGLKVLLCTVTETTVQLWEQDPNEPVFYTLIFQYTIKADFLGYHWVPFDRPITMTPRIKFGMLSAGQDKQAVPYAYDSSGQRLFTAFLSFDSYPPGSEPQVQDRIRFDDLVFLRTFSKFVYFCSNQDCPEDERSFLQPIILIGPKGDTGPPGSPGEPGVGCDAILEDPLFGLTPDAINGVGNQISEVKEDTENLRQIIQEMSNRITELTAANFVTGICPVGFAQGSYGVGACYYIYRENFYSFGEAQLFCRTQFAGTDASLMDIRTDIEDSFLRNQIQTLIAQTGDGEMETFWTAGMYSPDKVQWVWYDEIARLQSTLFYDNFRSNEDRDTAQLTKRCLTFNVDPVSETSYWKSDFCEARHYFICKVGKQCL